MRFVIAFSCCLLACRLSGQTIDFMTYNIRYDNPDDGADWWGHRKGEVADLIDYYEPHFVGMQHSPAINLVVPETECTPITMPAKVSKKF